MKKLFFSIALAIAAFSYSAAQKIDVLYTTDVHGAIFEYDFVRDTTTANSISKVASYIEAVRDTSDAVILLDNGDFLQGTPVVYFSNYVDSVVTNITARVFNYLKYDAVEMGNHDIEAGHAVYDKIVRQIQAPVLAANAIRNSDGKPYFKPYTVVERAGKRVAILGLLTPYIPHWLPEQFWSGMHFEDMIESARKWVPYIQEHEHPDVLIGLFHAGYDYTYGGQSADTKCNENATVLVAEQVEGFDAILIGHDHKLAANVVKSPSGRDVPILDSGTAARNIGHLQITFDKEGRAVCNTRLVATTNMPTNKEFNKTFLAYNMAVNAFTKKVIGQVEHNVYAYESLGGPSDFTSVVLRCMLNHSGADISMSAPLLIDVTIPAGEMKVGRLFSLYRFENALTVISLTGEEVLRYLEFSYDGWIHNPAEDGHVLRLTRRGRLVTNYYNLDSAAGINYTVDVTKEKGQRVTITSMADGTPFDPKKTYRIALNSYRANGGGGHLERGVGLSKEEIAERTIASVHRDLRGIIMEEFIKTTERGEKLDFSSLNNWKFIPESISEQLGKDVEKFKR